MGNASYMQTSFLGGEWAPEVQGRQETDAYKTGMNKCLNYFPIEQGSVLRRQGLGFIGHTRNGNPGRLTPFDLSDNPVQLEFTDGFIRFIQGGSFLQNSPATVQSISSATPAVVQTTSPHGYSTGDMAVFTASPGILGPLFYRQFNVTVVDATHFSLRDALSGASIVGTDIPAFNPGDYAVYIVAEVASPYVSGQWANCTFLHDEDTFIIFHPLYAPRAITRISTGFGFAISVLTIQDGPYLDINSTATTLTPSGTSGSVTLTASSTTGINGGAGFRASDVGRHIRLFNAPAAWNPASTYVVGDQVLYVDGNSYVAIKNNAAGIVPTNIDHWSLLAFLPYWSWLIVTAFTDTTHVTATIQQSTSSTNATLFNAVASKVWRLGLLNSTDGYPTVGTYHEERLWFSGIDKNRLDGSVSNQYFIFSPTGDDGTVSDANGIAFIIKGNRADNISWMATDDQGLLFGTLASEWKLKASTLDDPLTPSSVQARRLTTYGSLASVQPIHPLRMHVFVQAKQRKLIEIGHPTESGALYAPNIVTNLSLTGSHLSKSGIAEIAYTQEPKGIIWGRRNDGVLVGLTYTRDADKVHAGWHQHTLGHGRLVKGISSGIDTTQFTDRLYVVSKDGANHYWIERLTDVFDDNKNDWEMNFLDNSIASAAWVINGTTSITMWGCFSMAGATVSGSFGSLDIGDAVVAANGSVTFPFNSTFTPAYITAQQVLSPGITPTVGYTYTSQGQLLRPDHGQDAGARNGPAFGKKRRNHWFAALLNRTGAIKFGTTFPNVRAAKLASAGGTPVAASALFSGIVTDSITDDYSFDGMLAFQQTRPVPGQVLAIAGYIEVMDK